MTTNADFQSANQPTDATPQAEELADCIAYEDYFADAMGGGSIEWMDYGSGWESHDSPNREKLKSYIAKAINLSVASLRAQLAAAQAEAKAWESWGDVALDDFADFCTCNEVVLDDNGYAVRGICVFCDVSKKKPQPVDASSLARIARVALDGQKYVQATQLGDTYEEEERFEELHNSVDATTPNDIALAQALTGGASS